MKEQVMFQKLDDVVKKHEELTQLLMDPEVTSDPKKIMEYNKALNSINDVVEKYKYYKDKREELTSLKEDLKNEKDSEMKDMIHQCGGHNYSIFLDEETNVLYGYIEIEDEEKWAASADTAINRKWWDFMADIMETNPDNSPVSVGLKPVFHLD